jgi:Mg-chelatase subunit ChlD
MIHARSVQLAAVLLGSAAFAQAAAGDTRDVAAPALELSIETPAQGAVVGGPGQMVFIAGRVLATRGRTESADIVFAIDQSESASLASGVDLNRDGWVDDRPCQLLPPSLSMFESRPGLCPESGDSVFAGELLAARALLQRLDPRSVRAGVVVFSGDGDAATDDAVVAAPLTADLPRIRRTLDALEQEGVRGRTNLSAGVQAATRELLGSPGAEKILVLLSDGEATLPLEESRQENAQLAIEAAGEAGRLGVRVHVYCIGPDRPELSALPEVARAARGIFSGISDPRELRSILTEVPDSRIETLRVTNLTGAGGAAYLLRSADGHFASLLGVVQGKNTIEVYARASDGSEQTRTLELYFEPERDAPALAPQLSAQRNLLLEKQLSDLRERSLAVQAQRDEALRQELRAQSERAARIRRLRILAGGDAAREHP